MGPRFRSRLGGSPKATDSPARSRRSATTASRIASTVARRRPTLRAERKPGATVRHDAPRRELVEAVGQRGQQHRMANDRARGRRVEADPARPLGGQREDQVGVAPAVGMVVDAHSIEAGVLAARDELRNLRDARARQEPGCRPAPPALLGADPVPQLQRDRPSDRPSRRRHRTRRLRARRRGERRLGSRSAIRGTPVSARAWSTSFARISSARRTPAGPPAARP